MASASPEQEVYAEPPRIPPATPALQRAELERQEYIRSQERAEQRSVLRGLVLLALVALIFSMWRAGAGRVFAVNWWWP